jgi:histone-lysine N-methyltransferase SETMAR
MESRVVYSTSNLRNYNQEKTRLEHTVAVDETWVSLYRGPERDQAKEWRRPEEKSTSVVVPDRFGRKVMIILAMDIRGICYYEIIAPKEKVNSARYLAFLKRLVAKWGGNRKHELWLLDDNSTVHRAGSILTWLEKNNVNRWLLPTYSPDLSPCDFGCFHQLKRAIGGVQYPHVEALQKAIDNEIRYGNANRKYTAIEKLPERWLQCVNNKGEYL